MGALARFKQGGGGFLSNVDGEIVSILFTPDRPQKAGAKPSKKDASKRPLLFAKVTVQEDNKEEETTTHLLAGYADEWKISKDAKTITPTSDEAQLVGWGDLYPFIASAVTDAGFPEANLPAMEPGEPISFSGLEGERFHFVRRVDEKKTAEKGKRKYTAKDGSQKEANWDYLAVSKWYGEGAPEAASQVAGDEESDEERIARRAGETLVTILKDAKGNTISFKDLKLKVTTTLKSGDADKSAIRSFLDDEDNVEALGGIVYDRTSKNRTITLA